MLCKSPLPPSLGCLGSRTRLLLADRKLARSGGQVDALLGACWEETLEPGPYDFGDTTAFDRREKTGRKRSESEGRHSEGGRKDIDWGAVLQGDRFFALLQVRALTYGPTYAFALGCQNEGCRARFEWELDLTALPVRPLTDESRAAFTDGSARPLCSDVRGTARQSNSKPRAVGRRFGTSAETAVVNEKPFHQRLSR